MVNDWNIKQKKVRKTRERSQQPRNQDDTNWPAQPAVPTFNVEVTIQITHLNILEIFGDFLIYH